MNIIDFAKELNEQIFLYNIDVPILDGFDLIKYEGSIFTAKSKNNFIEQFLSDGKLKENETFEDHLNKTIEDTVTAMKKANLKDPDNNIIPLYDYKNDYFNYKVFLQDNIIDNKLTRQLNAYFLDPNTNAFYEIILSTCPYQSETFKQNNEAITNNLKETLNSILDLVKTK